MGKNTDKLYITHSEWSSEDAYSAARGSGGKSVVPGVNFRRLPFNFCAVSLLPFRDPICTSSGVMFDHENILEWLAKHGTNPVDGAPLKAADLVKLNFIKNDDGEYVDPVTYRVFTDNSHIVALRNTGNVFAWDTVERLNIKAKNWRDLVSEEEFSRKDIITLQDPQNLAARDLSGFKYVKDGVSTLTEAQEKERGAGVNADALGSSAKVLKAKEAVQKARAEREKAAIAKASGVTNAQRNGTAASGATLRTSLVQPRKQVYNAALHTTGRAAASFTSTGLTPETSGERAILSDEEYLLRPKRVKKLGYARLATTHGTLNVELHPEFAPKAVWNFIQLSKRGYYSSIPFHRNIKNFMIQGGDPTGTGRGGQSCWGKPFEDEIEGPLKHDGRGVMSMANKGKNTNGSQFFITYRQAEHLNRKHTIFGKVVGGMDTLSRLEAVNTDEKDRPTDDVKLLECVVFVDPFEEFLKERAEREGAEKTKEEIRRQGGTEDERTTWTGKRIRGDGTVDQSSKTASVGRYLKNVDEATMVEEVVGEWEEPEPEPVRKKAKANRGFGNFDSW